jgi:hypothetical protein
MCINIIMGKQLFDQYTLLHFAVGVIAYFWGMSFTMLFILHTIFEITENTTYGMYLINTLFKGIWPGGKPYADSIVNSIGDTIGAMLGSLCAYYLDYLGSTRGWYTSHLV